MFKLAYKSPEKVLHQALYSNFQFMLTFFRWNLLTRSLRPVRSDSSSLRSRVLY